MLRWGVFASMVSLCLAAGGTAQSPVSKLAQAKGWYLDYATARAEAQRSGKPLLVVFRCEP
jgi:hypothetical protein